jgi:hypothetical protein
MTWSIFKNKNGIFITLKNNITWSIFRNKHGIFIPLKNNKTRNLLEWLESY